MSAPAPLVVHVVYAFSVGGLENGLVNLLNRMPAQRWRHAVLSLTRISGGFAERVQRSDVEFIELDKRPGHLVRDYPRLYRLFRRLRPAVVHTRNLAALEAVVPAWAAGVPVRIHGEHGWNRADPDGRRRRYQYVRGLYRPFVGRYVALSRHLEEYLERQVGVPSHRVSQIYNGVDTERFRPAQVRSPIAGCPFGQSGDFLAGWIGRMDPVKDLPNLLQGFARASRSSVSRLRLVLVGGTAQSVGDHDRRPEHIAVLLGHVADGQSDPEPEPRHGAGAKAEAGLLNVDGCRDARVNLDHRAGGIRADVRQIL